MIRKRFKARKKNNVIIKIIIVVVLIYLITIFFKSFHFNLDYKNLIDKALNLSNYDLMFNKENILKKGSNMVTSSNIQDKFVFKTNKNEGPLVYIYNTHETEKYKNREFDPIDITYNVKNVSYILKEYLLKKGIYSYVEEESITKYLKDNNMNYTKSYEASRYYIQKRLEEYPDIKYIIDIHRDSVSKDISTTNMDGVNYAKIMFLVGMQNEKYESNLNVNNTLNSLLNSNLSRGILKKSGPYVNGIYNQDISENVLVIEIGGEENTIDEVENSIKELADVLYKYIGEKNGL